MLEAPLDIIQSWKKNTGEIYRVIVTRGRAVWYKIRKYCFVKHPNIYINLDEFIAIFPMIIVIKLSKTDMHKPLKCELKVLKNFLGY